MSSAAADVDASLLLSPDVKDDNDSNAQQQTGTTKAAAAQANPTRGIALSTTSTKVGVDDDELATNNIIPWTDASIRWEEEDGDDPAKKGSSSNLNNTSSKHHQEQNDDDDDDAEYYGDPFKDPNPTCTFTFRFVVPLSYCVNDDDNNDNMINIELDGYKYESDHIWTSTGLTLWNAAECLCHYLLQNQHKFLLGKRSGSGSNGEQEQEAEPRRILELGAGLGLCGILTHRVMTLHQQQQQQQQQQLPHNDDHQHNSNRAPVAAAERPCVYITDGDSNALELLQSNIQRNLKSQNDNEKDDDHNNDKSSTKAKTNTTTEIACRQLLWGRDYAYKFLQQHGTFHVIMASDIVYVKSILVPLWETIEILLDDDSSSQFILAYNARRNVNVTTMDVLSSATNAGFVYEEGFVEDGHNNNQKNKNDGNDDNNNEGCRIFVFRRRFRQTEQQTTS